MAERKRASVRIWRATKKGARGAWKLARLVGRRFARVGRAMWRAAFPRKRRRRPAPSPPLPPPNAAQPRSLIRIVKPSTEAPRSPVITAKRRAASFRALTGRFGRLPALVWLPAAALVLAVAVARGASQEPICALRDHIDAPTIQRDWPAVRRWCSQIMRAADRHYLNPHLIAALILVESGGDPLAYSSDGAVGLMQVMPRDGIAAGFWCYGRPCFANRPSIAELQDPAFNVDYGAMLLRFNLDRLGTWRDALRAYGPIYVGYDYADLVLAVFARVNP